MRVGTRETALVSLCVAACWGELRRGETLGADAGGGGSWQSSTSSSTSSNTTTSTGAGGAGAFVCDPPAADGHLYSFSAYPLDPTVLEPVSMCAYRGEVLLIVNTASQCVYTPQYEQLQALAANPTLAPAGFEVLGFISDDFHNAAGTLDDINACSAQYGVTFDQFAQIVVDSLPGQHPIFQWLTTQPGLEGPVTFNFNKFLVSRDGALLARWDETVVPDDPQIIAAIEGAVWGGN